MLLACGEYANPLMVRAMLEAGADWSVIYAGGGGEQHTAYGEAFLYGADECMEVLREFRDRQCVTES